MATPVPVISVTDLYHPPEDPGDNFDLIIAYGLPEVDLRAVVLDGLEEKRGLTVHGVEGYPGPRDPGVIAVAQLNDIFGRSVPCGIGPFTRMRHPEDQLLHAPRYQQRGIELILEVLASSCEPVHIMSFGSARSIAAAYNRVPDLVREKLGKIHLSAGTTSPSFLEWNVEQDPNAIKCLIGSELPIALYPCATSEGCCAYDHHNTFYWLEDLRWIERMNPRLRRYLGYAIGRSDRIDFLRVLETDLTENLMARVYGRRHAVWETAAWAQVSGRRIAQRADGSFRLVPVQELRPDDTIVPNELRFCRAEVLESGQYVFSLTDEPSNVQVFERGDPALYERALQEALPALYSALAPTGMDSEAVG